MSFGMLFLALASGLVIFATAWWLARWAGSEPSWFAKIGYMLLSYLIWMLMFFAFSFAFVNGGTGGGFFVVLGPIFAILPTLIGIMAWVIAPLVGSNQNNG